MWQRIQKLQLKRRDEDEGSRGDQSVLSPPLMQGEVLFQKHKRHRRTANEIERHYKCPVEVCSKLYGSEGSLNQHIKIKHPDFLFSQSKQESSLNPAPQSGAAQNPLA